MAVFAEIKTSNQENLWKALDAILAIAPYDQVELTATDIFDSATGALKALPAGWVQAGYLTEDGISFPASMNVSDVTSLGSASPTRRDLQSMDRTVSATAQELNRLVLEQRYGVDLATVAPSAAGVVEITQPDLPTLKHGQLLVVGKDSGPGGERYRAKYHPNVQVTEVGDETWNNQDNVMESALTYTAYNRAGEETSFGYPVREWIAFGSVEAANAAGFTATAPTG